MEINENHLKINESQSKPRVASAGIAKPSNKKTESCVVFKYVFFQMAQIAWNVCKDFKSKHLETARRGEIKGMMGQERVQAVPHYAQQPYRHHRPAVCAKPWSPL